MSKRVAAKSKKAGKPVKALPAFTDSKESRRFPSIVRDRLRDVKSRKSDATTRYLYVNAAAQTRIIRHTVALSSVRLGQTANPQSSESPTEWGCAFDDRYRYVVIAGCSPANYRQAIKSIEKSTLHQGFDQQPDHRSGGKNQQHWEHMGFARV